MLLTFDNSLSSMAILDFVTRVPELFWILCIVFQDPMVLLLCSNIISLMASGNYLTEFQRNGSFHVQGICHMKVHSCRIWPQRGPGVICGLCHLCFLICSKSLCPEKLPTGYGEETHLSLVLEMMLFLNQIYEAKQLFTLQNFHMISWG